MDKIVSYCPPSFFPCIISLALSLTVWAASLIVWRERRAPGGGQSINRYVSSGWTVASKRGSYIPLQPSPNQASSTHMLGGSRCWSIVGIAWYGVGGHKRMRYVGKVRMNKDQFHSPTLTPASWANSFTSWKVFEALRWMLFWLSSESWSEYPP